MSGRAVSFFSAGERVAALLWLPEAALRSPGIVLCHGLRGTKDWALPAYAAGLAEVGFAALTFDYRGLGESGGERGRLLPAEQVEDVRSALTFLGTLPEVDERALGVYGVGLGAGHAVAAAAADERIRAVVAQAGIGDAGRAWSEQRERLAPRMAEDRARRVATGRSETIDPGEILDNEQSREAFRRAAEELPGLRAVLTLEAAERLLEYAPERVAARIAPRALLVIGCARDEAAPVEESRRLFVAAGQPKRLDVLDLQHYELFSPPHREEVLATAVAWFAEHLR